MSALIFPEVLRCRIAGGIWGAGVEGEYLTPSLSPQLQKFTPMERGRRPKHLANSGGWVPIKGEPGTPHLPLTCPRACWGGTEGIYWALELPVASGPSQSPKPTSVLTEYSSDYQATDIAEIDARLKALQEYMNRLDTRS